MINVAKNDCLLRQMTLEVTDNISARDITFYTDGSR